MDADINTPAASAIYDLADLLGICLDDAVSLYLAIYCD
jgi:hypothetical protein